MMSKCLSLFMPNRRVSSLRSILTLLAYSSLPHLMALSICLCPYTLRGPIIDRLHKGIHWYFLPFTRTLQTLSISDHCSRALSDCSSRDRNRNLHTSKAPLGSKAQGTSLFTSAATNQRGC